MLGNIWPYFTGVTIIVQALDPSISPQDLELHAGVHVQEANTSRGSQIFHRRTEAATGARKSGLTLYRLLWTWLQTSGGFDSGLASRLKDSILTSATTSEDTHCLNRQSILNDCCFIQ